MGILRIGFLRSKVHDLSQVNCPSCINYVDGEAIVFPEFHDIIAVDSKTGIAILEEYAIPGRIASVTPGVMLAFMRRSGRNHHTLDDVIRLIDAAKNTIGIPDSDCVYAFRIGMNARRLSEEISHLRAVEKEIETRSSGNQDIV